MNYALLYVDTETQSKTPLTTPSKPLPVTSPQNVSTAVAQRNIAMIKTKFSALMTTSCRSLQTRKIDVFNVVRFLTIMYSSPDSRDDFDTDITVWESAKNLDEIFYILSKRKLWDHINYFLLQSIIERFADDDIELKSMMKQYQKDLTGHILALKIPAYLIATDAYKHSKNSTTNSKDDINLTFSFSSEEMQELFKKLEVKVDAKITDHSFSYIIDLWQSLSEQFVLLQPAMILHEIAEGCIGITWLIPANLVKYVTKMAQETSDMFAKQHILSVMLDEQCIYPMETDSSLPESEDASLKTKVNFNVLQVLNPWKNELHM